MTLSLEAPLRAALEDFALGRSALAAGPTVASLASGGVNRVFRVTSPAGDWAVRLAGAADGAFAINRVAESQLHGAAAALGFAPAIVHVAPQVGLLVTEYLSAAPVGREQMRSPGQLRALGARLGELHRAAVPRTVRRLDLYDTLLHYFELKDVPEGPISREILAARLRWSLASYRHGPFVLCHNDLHHRNVLGRDPLVFVDWEYGGVGDPLFELAAIVGYHDLDAELRALLLEAHGGDFKPLHVEQMCLVFDCVYALWLDAARAWTMLDAGHRDALVARLSIDPADREE